MIVICVNCDKFIDIDRDVYVVGASLGEYWCQECMDTGSDET